MGRFFKKKGGESDNMDPVLKKYMSDSIKNSKWKTATDKDIKAKQHRVYVERFSV